ncbi:hypothetical protein CBER1_07838 [Cercospora berteroae]|uniref:Uncharacterized protein n=1 Tax=Cercospora berteroae TaxID=357750 RepID=A0A2S6C532_9PEZI|nr:hypothetical protein CBER1_07838 [Cercospora berteroae]
MPAPQQFADLRYFETEMESLAGQQMKTLAELFDNLGLKISLCGVRWGVLNGSMEDLVRFCLGNDYNEANNKMIDADVLSAFYQTRALVSAFTMRSIFGADLLTEYQFTRYLDFPKRLDTLSALCKLISSSALGDDAVHEQSRMHVLAALKMDMTFAAVKKRAAVLRQELMSALEPFLHQLVMIAEPINGYTRDLSADRKWSSSLSSSLERFLADALKLKVSLITQPETSHAFRWADHGCALDVTSMHSRYDPEPRKNYLVAMTNFPGLSIASLHRNKSSEIQFVPPTCIAVLHRNPTLPFNGTGQVDVSTIQGPALHVQLNSKHFRDHPVFNNSTFIHSPHEMDSSVSSKESVNQQTIIDTGNITGAPRARSEIVTAASQAAHGPSHHCLLYAVRDIDASKHDRFHEDYKYRDSDSRLRAFALLIRQYGLTKRPLKGGLVDIEPATLLKRVLASFKKNANTSSCTSPAARADLLFSTGSVHFESTYWAFVIERGEGYVHDEGLELYGNEKCVSRSRDVEELLSEICLDEEESSSEPDSSGDVKCGASEEVMRAQRQIGRGVFKVLCKRPRQADIPILTPEPSISEGAETTSTAGRHGRIGLRTKVRKLGSQPTDAPPMATEVKESKKHVVSRTQVELASAVRESVAGLLEQIRLSPSEHFTYDSDCNDDLGSLYRLCCGQNWIQTIDTFRQRRFPGSADILTALISAAIFRKVLSEQQWIVTLFCESGLKLSEDHQEAFRLAIDPAHRLKGIQLATAIFARTLRKADENVRYAEQLAQMITYITARIVGALKPCIEVLVVLSRALDPNWKTFDVGSWREKFTSDIHKVVTKAIELSLNAWSSHHGRYQFFWPAHGELFNPDIHRSIDSQGTRPKNRIAIALGSGLRWIPAEDDHTSRPKQGQNQEGERNEESEAPRPGCLGLVEVVTCDELISPEIRDVSEESPPSQQWYDARA